MTIVGCASCFPNSIFHVDFTHTESTITADPDVVANCTTKTILKVSNLDITIIVDDNASAMWFTLFINLSKVFEIR